MLKQFSFSFLLIFGFGISNTTAESLNIVSWGGVYEESQYKALFQPFSEKTGIPVNVIQYNGGLSEIQEQIENQNVTWDLVDLTMADNLRGCRLEILEPIAHEILLFADADDNTNTNHDFYPNTLTKCGVGQVIYSTVIAFDPRQFSDEKPDSIEDFFDLEKFPGKRGLQRKPIALLEWALMSYGIPKQEIYSLLSTSRGLDLAFKKLDQIRSHIVWWDDASMPVELLKSSQVSITSGFNGRFFDAAVNQNLPVQVIWDGQLTDLSTWGIPTGAPNADTARKFIQFAVSSAQLAELTKYISYGPARKSSNNLVTRHALTGIDIRPYLPTFPANLRLALATDHVWYSRTNKLISDRFQRWLNK